MILKSISFVTIGLILGKLTSFIKHAIIVKYAGIGSSADIFFLANTIPETVINVIMAGILTGAFIPLASEVLAQNGNITFKHFINNSFYLMGLILAGLAGILYVFAEIFSQLLAPGYDSQQLEMVENILRIFSPGILFIGMAAILTGTLQSIEKFLVPSFGLFIANITTILFIVFFFKDYGIYAAAIGTSLGFFLWFLYQLPFTIKYLIPIISLDFKGDTVHKLIKLTIPTILVVVISNFVLIIEKIFATSLQVGTITQINLAFRLTLIFSSILVLPLGTVLLPKMSKQFAKDNLEKLYKTITDAFSVVSILLFVVVIIVVINAETIALVIYAPLGISNEAFAQIGDYLRIYSFVFLGLFFYPITLRVFFSIQRVRYLVTASILGFIAYTSFVLLLIAKFDSYVLPMGYGVFYLTMIVFLFWIMKKKIFPNHPFYLDRSIFQTGFFFTLLTIVYYYVAINTISNIYINIFFTIIFILTYLFLLRKNVWEIIATLSKRAV